MINYTALKAVFTGAILDIYVSKKWYFACLVIIAANIVGSGFHLDANSLWTDELFTAYISDPSEPALSEVILKSAADVHPPGYYVVVWFAAQLTDGDIGMVARGTSAVLGAATLFVIYVAFPYWVGTFSRMVACTLVASSSLYFYYTQEARSYTFTWLIVSLQLMLMLRIGALIRNRNDILIPTILISLVGVCGALTHNYLVPISGGIYAALLLICVSWKQRVTIATGGLIVLISSASFLKWQSGIIVMNIQDTWFDSSLHSILKHTYEGVMSFIQSPLELALYLIIIFAGVFGIKNALAKLSAPDRAHASISVLLLIGAALIGFLFMQLVNILYAPSFSLRFIVTQAPFVWIGMGFLMESVYRYEPAQGVKVFRYMIIALLLLLSGKIFLRDQPSKFPWRETAEYVESMDACTDAPLPVAWLDDIIMPGLGPQHFYGYYLDDNVNSVLAPQLRSTLSEYPANSDIHDLVVRRISGEDKCNLLLWSVHVSSETLIEQVQKNLQALAEQQHNGSTIEVISFPASESNWLHDMLGLPPVSRGYVIVSTD